MSSLTIVARSVVAIILIAASVLKLHRGITLGEWGIPSYIMTSSALFGIVLSVFEGILALLLVSGTRPRIVRHITIILFVVFFGVSFIMVFSRDTSCNCLGRITVPPQVMAIADIIVILCMCLEDTNKIAFRPRIAAGLGIALCLTFGITALHAVLAYHLSNSDQWPHHGTTIVFRPEDFIGKGDRFNHYVRMRQSTKRGEWIALLYKWECPCCQEAVSQLTSFAYTAKVMNMPVRIALIEVPGSPLQSAVTQQLPPTSDQVVRGELTSDYKWHGHLPIALRIVDGEVINASVNLSTILAPLIEKINEEDDKQEQGPDYSKIMRKLYSQELTCGPNSVIDILMIFIILLDEDMIGNIFNEIGNGATDMLTLRGILEKFGLHAIGVELGTGHLRRIGKPAIVHLDGIGFAAVTNYLKDGIVISRQLGGTGVLPDDLFERSFGKTGYALITDDKPIDVKALGFLPPESKPSIINNLVFDKSMLSVGGVYCQNWQATMGVRNVGTRTVHIRGILSSCPSCIDVSIVNNEIPAGGTSKLAVKGKRTGIGGFMYKVTITTDDAPNETYMVNVRGFLDFPVELPASPVIDLGTCAPGESRELKVPIKVASSIPLSDLVVHVTRPISDPACADSLTEVLRASIDPTNRNSIYLKLSWKGSDKPGYQRFKVTIQQGPLEYAVRTPYYVLVRVVPKLDALTK